MNYTKLFQSNLLAFKDTILKNYKQIGLNDFECLILLQLSNQKLNEDDCLSIANLSSIMTSPYEFISEVVLRLVERGYIDLHFSKNGSETFSLEPIYKLLGSIIEAEEKEDQSSMQVEQIIGLIQTYWQKDVTPVELQTINQWLDEKIPYEDIEKVIIDCSRLKKLNIRYADTILMNRRSVKTVVEEPVNNELKMILESINVRRR